MIDLAKVLIRVLGAIAVLAALCQSVIVSRLLVDCQLGTWEGKAAAAALVAIFLALFGCVIAGGQCVFNWPPLKSIPAQLLVILGWLWTGLCTIELLVLALDSSLIKPVYLAASVLCFGVCWRSLSPFVRALTSRQSWR
jgi:hypothetical protein